MLTVGYAEGHLEPFMLNDIMLNVFMLNVFMLNVFMLSVMMLNVFVLSVIMLNVVEPFLASLKNFSGTNALAYQALLSVTMKVY